MTKIQSWLFPNASHLVANLLFLITLFPSLHFFSRLFFPLSIPCAHYAKVRKNVNRNLINSQQTQRFRQTFVKKKWLQVNKEMAF
jgi:hypothetical protein